MYSCWSNSDSFSEPTHRPKANKTAIWSLMSYGVPSHALFVKERQICFSFSSRIFWSSFELNKSYFKLSIFGGSLFVMKLSRLFQDYSDESLIPNYSLFFCTSSLNLLVSSSSGIIATSINSQRFVRSGIL
jgi:hypothetical protein